MQHVKSLLGITLIFATFAVQAETQNDPNVAAPAADAQAAGDDCVGASRQTKDPEEQAATRTQRVTPGSNQSYQTPLSAYNNGGYFGE